MKKAGRRLVQVIWNDAWQDQDNFATAHGIQATHEPMVVQTLGWLIVDNEIGISVANEVSSQDGKDVFRGRTFVPRAMIVEVKDFTLTAKKKKAETPVVPALESPAA